MTITVTVTPRDKKTKTEALRASGLVPAVVYGPKQPATDVVINEKEFEKVRKEAGESSLLSLAGLEKPVDVLIKSVDFNPVKQRIAHIDFYAVEQGKEITTHVPLHFIGEAPAEQTKAGLVTKVLHEVEVTCQPSVLPAHIDTDLSTLVAVDDRILVKDLSVAAGVRIAGDPEQVVAIVSEQKEEEMAEETANTPEVAGETAAA